MDLLKHTASLPGGSGQWTSCNTLPHCLGAVGSGTPAIHCLPTWRAVGSGPPAIHCVTAWGALGSGPPATHCLTDSGQWAVPLLQYTTSLPRGSGQWTSCNTLPHCLEGSGQWTSCNTLRHCLGAVGSGPAAIHCPNARGQWAVELLQYTASLHVGQWALDLLQCTARMPGGSGQWTPCNTLPHCLGVVGSGPPATHCLTAWGQWAVGLLQCTASLPGAKGSATPATHRLTARG